MTNSKKLLVRLGQVGVGLAALGGAGKLGYDYMSEDQREAIFGRFIDVKKNTPVEKPLKSIKQVKNIKPIDQIEKASLPKPKADSLYGDDLERVIKTLKKVHAAETEQAVEDAVSKERKWHSRRISKALKKLREMEMALESRAGLDAESRHAKFLWLACQSLLESIAFGKKAGLDFEKRRKPLGNEVNVIVNACENDQFVAAVAKHFPESALKSGVYTEQDLKNRFKKIYKSALRTANVDENNATLIKYVSSWIQSLFIIDLPRTYSPDDAVKLSKLDNREIVSRARYFVEKGDFLTAVRLSQLLTGQPSVLVRDWVKDAQEYLESQFLTGILLAHSAASSVRSIY